MLFRSRPQVVEAIQWTGNERDIRDWATDPAFSLHDSKVRTSRNNDDSFLQVKAGLDGVQGWVPVPLGHFLVRRPGDWSDIWPVEENYFNTKYEELNGDVEHV
jgi:hypothetical protein